MCSGLCEYKGAKRSYFIIIIIPHLAFVFSIFTVVASLYIYMCVMYKNYASMKARKGFCIIHYIHLSPTAIGDVFAPHLTSRDWWRHQRPKL